MKVAILALLVVCLFASNLDRYVELIGKDSCAGKVINNMRPEIEAANNQVEALTLISKAKQMMDACPQQISAPANADQIEKDGIALLLGSNCEKDAGMMLLIGDTIYKDPKDITNDIVVVIIEGILGMQAVKDCEQFEHYVIPHH